MCHLLSSMIQDKYVLLEEKRISHLPLILSQLLLCNRKHFSPIPFQLLYSSCKHCFYTLSVNLMQLQTLFSYSLSNSHAAASTFVILTQVTLMLLQALFSYSQLISCNYKHISLILSATRMQLQAHFL